MTEMARWLTELTRPVSKHTELDADLRMKADALEAQQCHTIEQTQQQLLALIYIQLIQANRRELKTPTII